MTGRIDQARVLLGQGQAAAAVTALGEAVRLGDALAARELGLWFLQGSAVPRDLAASRRWFEHGAVLGDGASAAVFRAFVAQGTGDAADWPRAVQLVEAAAGTDPAAKDQASLIAAMALTATGDPAVLPQGTRQSEVPLISLFPGFLSPAECDYLVRTAEPMLSPSVIVDPQSGRQVANPLRTSDGAAFPLVDENPAIHALNRRIAAAAGSDVRCGEPLQVLRYAPGQEYRLHSDALPGCPPAQQRVLTFLIWLNDDYGGGETEFPRLSLRLRGGKGDGLLFASTLPDGQPDPRAIHAGLPVSVGKKMLASRWIRATPLIY